MTPEQAVATVAATLARSDIEGISLSETLARPSGWLADRSSRVSWTPGADDFRLLGELGRGGMGVVHVAEQRSLGREVVVKRSLGDEASARALLHEARILGGLEHPNLVPVHALRIDADGIPSLAMKRVSGVAWDALLRDPSHVAWTPLVAGHGDRLRANLEILGDVCRALSFAHESGVIHRDLKPANVMIGRFGEVMLLDWGIALRLADRDQEPKTIVGTPGYLPPELAGATPEAVDARTDVYLLGATLYEILTGRVPHAAPTALAAIVASLLGTPPIAPEGSPALLVALAARAMAHAQGDRIASAEAFRLELGAFLRSLDADRIAIAARASIARAESLVASEGPASSEASRALVEARFGLAAALEARPDDAALRTELEACVIRLVEREIAIGSAPGARSMLAQVQRSVPALVLRIESLEAADRARADAAAENARARREADLSIGAKAMRIGLVASALTLPVGALFAWRVFQTGGVFTDLLFGDTTLVSVGLCTLAIMRKRVLATTASRRVTAILIGWCALCVGSDVVTWVAGGSVRQAAIHSLFTAMVVLAMGAATVMRALWPAVVVNLLAVVAAAAMPAAGSGILVTSLLVSIVLFWRALRVSSV